MVRRERNPNARDASPATGLDMTLKLERVTV
jgi:hypothetical protein